MARTACLVVCVALWVAALWVAVAKLLAVKVGKSVDPARLPCLPISLVSPPALSACLPCLFSS